MGTMGLSCCSKFAKYFLFLFNIIFWLVGAIILGVGIWALVDDDVFQLLHVAGADSSDSMVNSAAITFVVLGSIVFITGFFGCCGAIRESPCMLMTYACIIGFVLVLQIIAGILAVVFKDQIQDSLVKTMNNTVHDTYGVPGKNTTTQAWDFMQVEFSCCGAINGPSEWENSAWEKLNPTQQVPLTCCTLKNDNYLDPEPVNTTLCFEYAQNTNATDATQFVHTQGCQPQLYEWVTDHAAVLIGIAFGLAVIQVIVMMGACCLGKRIKSSYEYV